MKFIVNAINIFLALPIHFGNIKVTLMGQPINIISDFSLELDPKLKICHYLSFLDVSNVLLELVLYVLNSKSLG